MIDKNNFNRERGNALFLILIAVALFAALSYAVTQSGSGGGTIDREQSLISASQLTQYPSLVRTTVTRMVLTGTTIQNLSFDSTPPAAPSNPSYRGYVFRTFGGAVTYQIPPASSGASDWGFTHDIGGNGYYITGIGTDGATGEEVMMFANGVTLNVCEQVRSGLGLSVTPTDESVAFVPPTYTYANEQGPTAVSGGGTAAGSNNFSFNSDAGEPYSCVENGVGAGTYIYYHALIEQ